MAVTDYVSLETPRQSNLDRSFFIQYGVTILTVVLVLGPLLPIVYQSFIDRPLYDPDPSFTLSNYTDLLVSQSFGKIIINTVLFASMTTLAAQAIGVAGAILVGRCNIPGRKIFGELLLWPLYVSHLLLAFGWFALYGPAGYITQWFQGIFGFAWNVYSLPAMGLIAGISQAPVVMLFCLGSTALADSSLEDAARSCGAGGARTLFKITLPLMLPAIVYSGVLTFTGALEMLSIPLIFGERAGIQMFSTLLYSQGMASARPNYGYVGAAAVILVFIVAGLVFLQGLLLKNSRRYVTVGGKSSRRRVFDLGTYRWPVAALLAAYIILLVVGPMAVLILRASVSFLTPLVPFWTLFTTRNFETVFSAATNIRAITNTVFIAAVGGAIATAFVTVVTITSHRSDFRFGRTLEYFAMLPRSVPGIVAGIGFFYAMVFIPPMGWLRSTVWILILAYTMRYIPSGFGALSPSLLQIGPDLDRAARIMGADWWTASRRIIAPLLKPAVFSCFALMFIYFLKEYTVAIFLFAPGSEVIGTTLLQYWVVGDVGALAVLATVQIAITAVFVALAQRGLNIKIYG